MRHSTLSRVLGISLLLGTATIACTPGAHLASASQ
ncbi:MAG: hypothetical protein JWO65_2072 [Sphingomonas bacterium]|nr:hypothetical protein [Sphingomonas bacterium]